MSATEFETAFAGWARQAETAKVDASKPARMSQQVRPEVAGPMTGSVISRVYLFTLDRACRFAHAGHELAGFWLSPPIGAVQI
jgi:hypothetical protein